MEPAALLTAASPVLGKLFGSSSVPNNSQAFGGEMLHTSSVLNNAPLDSRGWTVSINGNASATNDNRSDVSADTRGGAVTRETYQPTQAANPMMENTNIFGLMLAGFALWFALK